jgi:hypothetical protein
MYINIYILKKADPPVASAIFRMPHGRGRHEEVAGRCGNRFDRAAATGIHGPVIARLDGTGTGVGPHRGAGCRCRRQPVLSGYLSRNLVITVTGAIFLLTRQWAPLAVLLTVTAALPVFDMTVLSSNGVTPPVFHPLALALIAITAALAWRRVAAGKD